MLKQSRSKPHISYISSVQTPPSQRLDSPPFIMVNTILQSDSTIILKQSRSIINLTLNKMPSTSACKRVRSLVIFADALRITFPCSSLAATSNLAICEI